MRDSMDILFAKAVSLNEVDLYEDLVKWNENQNDKPLNDFNDEWLNDNKFLEADYLYSIATRVYKELSLKHSVIILMVLRDYDNIYAKEALDYIKF